MSFTGNKQTARQKTDFAYAIEEIMYGAKMLAGIDEYPSEELDEETWRKYVAFAIDLWKECQGTVAAVAEAQTELTRQLKESIQVAEANGRNRERDQQAEERNAERARLDAEDDATLSRWSKRNRKSPGEVETVATEA